MSSNPGNPGTNRGTSSTSLASTAIPRSSPPRRPIVDGLGEVDNGRVIKRLQYLRDGYETLSPEEMYLIVNPAEVGATAEAQFIRKARRLVGWRNGLVLLPLMITWLSLGLASIAYAQSIALDPKLVAQPFLKQWADGFPKISTLDITFVHIPLAVNGIRLFTFGEIALIDCILLAILLCITLTTQFQETRAHKRSVELSTWLEEELYELSRESLVRSLGPGPGNKQPLWAVEVHAAISHLSGVLAEVKNVVSSFGDAVQRQQATISQVIDITERVAISIDHLDAIFQRGKETYDKLDGVLPRIETQFGSLASSQNQSVIELQKISENLGKATRAIIDIAQPFSEAGVARLTHDAALRMQRISEEQLRIHLAQQAMNPMGASHAKQSQPQYHIWDVRRYIRK